MRRIGYALVSAVIVVTGPGYANAKSLPVASALHATVLVCKTVQDRLPLLATITVSDMHGHVAAQGRTSVSRTGIASLSVRLASGRYFLEADSGPCVAFAVAQILRDEPRHIVLATTMAVSGPRIGAALAGVIAVRGVVKVLYQPEGCADESCTYVASMDGDAYYFSAIPPGKGAVAIYLFGDNHPVRVAVIVGNSPMGQVQNIGVSDLVAPRQ